MRLPLALAAILALGAVPAAADDVTETIESALQAYQEGDIQYALEELTFAQQLLQKMKAGQLADFLPPAQEGWTRTIDEEAGRGLAAMGGTGAEAEYSGDGGSFTISIMADSPMIAGFAGMMGNSAMMAQMGDIERVGREKFIDQDGELTGVIGNRILVQAKGADPEVMIGHLKQMDFRALSNFGS